MEINRRSFLRDTGAATLFPSPLNPVELAGNEGHLRPIQICLQPSQNDRDTRVEVSPVAA